MKSSRFDSNLKLFFAKVDDTVLSYQRVTGSELIFIRIETNFLKNVSNLQLERLQLATLKKRMGGAISIQSVRILKRFCRVIEKRDRRLCLNFTVSPKIDSFVKKKHLRGVKFVRGAKPAMIRTVRRAFISLISLNFHAS